MDFEVEDFYALGSPIGLFQMLKGRTISARSLPNVDPNEPAELEDPRNSYHGEAQGYGYRR